MRRPPAPSLPPPAPPPARHPTRSRQVSPACAPPAPAPAAAAAPAFPTGAGSRCASAPIPPPRPAPPPARRAPATCGSSMSWSISYTGAAVTSAVPEHRHVLLQRARGDEVGHGAVAGVDVAHPVGVGAEARIVDHVRPARSPGTAAPPSPGSTPRSRCSARPACAYTLRGEVVCDRLPGAAAFRPTDAVDRRVRPQDRHDRIEQRQVDHLAPAAALRPRAAPPSPRRRRTAPPPCRPSPAAAAPARGRRSRSWPRSRSCASTSVPNPGRSRYGPSWPKPETRTMTSAGLRACSTSGPSPIVLQRAGPVVLDQHLAAGREVEQRRRAPPVRRRLSARLFLLRA